MADRFPLIFNTSAGQIQELASSDNLDMTSSSISNLSALTVSGTVTANDFNSVSDRTFKVGISTITDPITKVQGINGVTFTWIDGDNVPSAGVIAQDVEAVFPEVVHTNGDAKAVNYNGLIGLLVEVTKKQQETIAALQVRIEALEASSGVSTSG